MYKKNNLWVDVFAWQIHENITGGVDGGGILGAGSLGGGTVLQVQQVHKLH